MAPTITSIILTNCTLGSPSTPFDWTAFFNNHPSLTSVSIINSGLTGSLPSSLPSGLTSFVVSSNALTGSIPTGIFSNSTGVTSFTFDCSGNRLTGSLPSSLFTIQSAKLTTISFDAHQNQLSGTLPSDLVTSTANVLRIILQQNKLSGSLPSRLFGSSTGALTLYIDDNNISGVIPADLFTGASLASVGFSLTNNSLTGSIPADLFLPLASIIPNAVVTLILDSNKLTGTVPETLFSNGAYRSQFYFSASDNQLNGTLPANLLNFGQSASMTALVLDLSQNRLSGLSDGFFANLNASKPLATNFYLSNNLITGTIPSTMFQVSQAGIEPGRYDSFNCILNGNQLSGSLPAALFSNITAFASSSIQLYFSSNALHGSIPSTLFDIGSHPFNASTGTTSSVSPLIALSLNLDGNQLDGSIPETIWSAANWTSLVSVTFSVGSNQLSGSLPPHLWNVTVPNALNLFTFTITNNSLSGTIPAGSWIGDFKGLAIDDFIFFDASYNALSGALPTDIIAFPSSINTLSVNLQNNNLSGSLPTKLFSNSNVLSASLLLSNNNLRGSVSAEIFSTASTSIALILLEVSNNPLGGTLADELFSMTTTINSLYFTARNCSIAGQITSSLTANNVNTLGLDLGENLFSQTLDFSSLLKGTNTLLQLTLDNNAFTGTLSFPNASSTKLTFNISGANLEQLDMPEAVGRYLQDVDMSNNPSLTGTLPSTLFNFTSVCRNVAASSTSISGEVPGVNTAAASYAASISLRDTLIDFCPTSTVLPYLAESLSTCSFGANAAANCRHSYPSMCFDEAVTPSPSPPASTPSPPSACPLATRPTPDFQCVDGLWVYYGTVTTGSLTIPSGATQTIINGSLVTTSLVFQGTSTVLVTECVYNLTTVTIELTEEELKKLQSGSTQLLINYGGANSSCDDLGAVSVQATLKGSSCHKVTAKSVATKGTLSALFSISSSACNRWWIILVSVIGGLIVIALVVLVLLILFVPKVKYFFRPYARPREGPTAAAL